MKIGKNSVVTLGDSVTDTAGNLIDGGAHPIVYLHGGYEGIFPKIEEALSGKSVGDSLDITLAPEDAFGEYDETLVEVEDAGAFDGKVELGMQFSQGDDEDALLYVVTDMTDGKVVLDANHPLSGMEIAFSCTVTNVREATKEELENKVANG
ncbi:MAG TPA: peptidylprolyl isomerase [Campylobacterales bacterium]|nr:peptidylprolyl isomerase [Campylobacterales bacterium]